MFLSKATFCYSESISDALVGHCITYFAVLLLIYTQLLIGNYILQETKKLIFQWSLFSELESIVDGDISNLCFKSHEAVLFIITLLIIHFPNVHY